MDITYLGHSSFKIKGNKTSVVTDPYDKSVGFTFPRVSADIVTVSHDHHDHNNFSAVSGTSRREEPFLIKYPGEYEVSGVSVCGFETFHDENSGADRGDNIIFEITVDGVVVAHLGDIGHQLKDKLIEEMGDVDVLLIPVGGVYTVDPKTAMQVIGQIQPSIVVPMHYKTKRHDEKTFGKLATLKEFLFEAGSEDKKKLEKLTVNKSQLPEELEIVVLKE